MVGITKWALPAKRWLQTDRLGLVVIAFAIVVQLIVVSRLFAPGELAGDDMSIHLAEIAGIERSLASGDLDLWNPSANGGFASGYFYQFLPQLACAVAYLLFGWLVSLSTIFKLSVAAALVALPLATYRGFRIIGADNLVAAAAALGASTVYASSGWGGGIDSLFSTGLYTQAFALAFYPLALAYAARFLLTGQNFGRAVLYTLLTGFCHPFIAVAIAPPLLFIPWWNIGLALSIKRGALLFAGALAGSAPLWLPIVVHYDAFGGFPARVGGEEGIPAEVFFPEFIRGAYLDFSRRAITTALVVITIPVYFLRGGRLLVPIFAAGALFALLIAAGPNIGKTEDDLLPMVRFLAPMQLFLGAAAWAAASVGVIELIRWARPRVGKAAPLVAAAISAFVLFASFQVASGANRRSDERVRTVYSYKKIKREELGKIIAFLKTQPPGRVLAADEYGSGSHWWMYLHYVYAGAPAVRAYGGAALQSSPNFVFLRKANLLTHHSLWGTRYLIASNRSASSKKHRKRFGKLDGEVIYNSGGYRVYALAGHELFRAIESAGRLTGTRKQKTKEIEKFLKRKRARPERSLIEAPPLPALAVPDAVTIAESRHSRRSHAARVVVDGNAPALLRLAVTYHPGWSATVDGEPAEVRRVSPAFVAVLVPPGAHTVRFTFVRPAWTWLLYLILFAASLSYFWRTRRTPVPRAVARPAVTSLSVLVFVLVVLTTWAGTAVAEPDAYPNPVDVAFRGNRAIVATTAGLLVRDARGEPFRYVCPDASGSKPGAFSPRVAIRVDGSFVATSYRGIRTSANACDFELARVETGSAEHRDLWFSDVTASPTGLWAVTADAHFRNDVYHSALSGDPLLSSGLRSDRFWYIGVSANPKGTRVYASGYMVAGGKGDAKEVVPLLLENGEVAKAQYLEAGRSGRVRVVLAPEEAEVFVVAEGVSEPRGDVLYRSTDAGALFLPVLKTETPIVGVARDRGGATWVASRGQLYRARNESSDYKPVEAPPLSCLATDADGAVVGCRADAVATGIVLSRFRGSDDVVGFETVLRTTEIAAPCGTALLDCRKSWSRSCTLLGASCDVAPPPDREPALDLEELDWERSKRWIALAIAVLAALVIVVILVVRMRR